MARLLFPAADDLRLVYRTGTDALKPVAAGVPVQVWADEDATVAADVQHVDGSPVTSAAPLLVDAYSQLPRWLGPADGTTRLYVTLAGGAAAMVTADLQDQIDAGTPTSRQIIAGTGLSGGGDLSQDRTLTVVYGTAAGTAASGNDVRLSDARTPTAHASSHAAAGGDPVTQPAILRRTADAYAATVTPDISTSDLLDVGTLTGNVTIANPTGSPVDGQVLRLRLAQDGTGGRTVTFGSAYRYGTDVTASLVPTGANARWVMMVMYHAAAAEWWVVSIVRGY